MEGIVEADCDLEGCRLSLSCLEGGSFSGGMLPKEAVDDLHMHRSSRSYGAVSRLPTTRAAVELPGHRVSMRIAGWTRKPVQLDANFMASQAISKTALILWSLAHSSAAHARGKGRR